jgi:hypothetical protein
MGMKFKIADLQRQMNEIAEIASEYLDRGSKEKLKDAARNVKFISKQPTGKWQIDRSDPIKTIPSWGACEKDGKGKDLQGWMSFVWGMKRGRNGIVELNGKASTVITIHEIEKNGRSYRLKHAESEWLQRWNIDVVTDEGAPGPAIHAQISNRANVPVPRLPSILFTPADCLDFLLGELFQENWEEHLAGHSHTASFAVSQQDRMQRLLKEHDSRLQDRGRLSAWTNFKKGRPTDDLFLVS